MGEPVQATTQRAITNRTEAMQATQALIRMHQTMRRGAILDIIAEAHAAAIDLLTMDLEHWASMSDEDFASKLGTTLTAAEPTVEPHPTLMLLDDALVGPQLDIGKPTHGVQVQVDDHGQRVWVNVDGVLRLRVCAAPKIEVEDARDRRITYSAQERVIMARALRVAVNALDAQPSAVEALARKLDKRGRHS